MKFRRGLFSICLLIATGLSASDTQTKNFTFRIAAEHLITPWSLNFTPDGELLFSARDSGEIVSLNGNKTASVARLGGLRTGGEAGFLGMALSPDFENTRAVYVCYSTGTAAHPTNRVSKVTWDEQGLNSEKIIIDNLPGGARIHNGCRLAFGPDGKLYITMGENGRGERAQDLKILAGKILRVNPDGTIPADNPFRGSPVWTYGHRNPQGLAFHPVTNELWSTEHGPATQDELNVILEGRNYGWPLCLGTDACPQLKDYQPAVAEFNRNSTVAISDMIFYSGKAKPEWAGNILFVTLKTGRIYRVAISGHQMVDSEILLNGDFGRLRDIAEDKDGNLWISTDNDQDSRIIKLTPR